MGSGWLGPMASHAASSETLSNGKVDMEMTGNVWNDVVLYKVKSVLVAPFFRIAYSLRIQLECSMVRTAQFNGNLRFFYAKGCMFPVSLLQPVAYDTE